jgi:hypothetical protein
VNSDEWLVDDVMNDDLKGCVDIDLGWTPATNTLPIRCLGLHVGESAETVSAWLRFPEMDSTAATQSYTRVSDNLWRYRSGHIDYDLEVSADGVVCRYGDLWWGSVEAVT